MTIRTKVLWALWGCDLHRKWTENNFWLSSHQFKSPRRPRARDARRWEMNKPHSQLHVLCYRYCLNILHCGLLIYISWLTVLFYFGFFQFSKKMKWNYYNIWFSISSQVHLILMAWRSGPSFSTVLLLIVVMILTRDRRPVLSRSWRGVSNQRRSQPELAGPHVCSPLIRWFGDDVKCHKGASFLAVFYCLMQWLLPSNTVDSSHNRYVSVRQTWL